MQRGSLIAFSGVCKWNGLETSMSVGLNVKLHFCSYLDVSWLDQL